jgi:chromosome segregation ATPase
VAYFHSLHWEKRREIIYSLAGNITDTDVLTSGGIEDAVKDKINEIINSGKSFSDAKAEANGKKKRIKDELNYIPARIDEAERSKPEPIDAKTLEAEINELEAQKEDKETQIEKLMTDLADSAKVVNEKNAERTARVAGSTSPVPGRSWSC